MSTGNYHNYYYRYNNKLSYTQLEIVIIPNVLHTLHHHDCPSVVLSYMYVTLSSMTPSTDLHNSGDISSEMKHHT